MSPLASRVLKRLTRFIPKTATAPFCPSEVQGSIEVSRDESAWKKLLLYTGPGLLISVGYMDPGNWATDIEAGSKYGYSLLFIVLFSSLAAIVLQTLSMRLGLVSGRDLAKVCRDEYSKSVRIWLWILAEIAIIATDVAEVLGSALAFKLLFGVSLPIGIAMTSLDTLIILGLKGKGFRKVEAIILGLISTIGICYLIELYLIPPEWGEVFRGFVPHLSELKGAEPWYLAVGILGATVMPHNLYLHSSIVQTRKTGKDRESVSRALKWASVDTVGSLSLALLINAAILILAASAFHGSGHGDVTEIDSAYRLLDPIVGSSFAALVFGVALLASGQSSTFTGTIAGQVLMEGFLELKIPCWKRRVITRGLALVPAYLGVSLLGENSTGRLLVLSQVVLSFQLPFAIYPLIRFTSSPQIMGSFKNGVFLKTSSWFLFALISMANILLVYELVSK